MLHALEQGSYGCPAETCPCWSFTARGAAPVAASGAHGVSLGPNSAKQLVGQYPAMCVAAWAYITAAIAMGTTAVLFVERAGWELPNALMGPLVYWILICSVLGYYVVTWATQHLPASQARPAAVTGCQKKEMGVLACPDGNVSVACWAPSLLPGPRSTCPYHMCACPLSDYKHLCACTRKASQLAQGVKASHLEGCALPSVGLGVQKLTPGPPPKVVREAVCGHVSVKPGRLCIYVSQAVTCGEEGLHLPVAERKGNVEPQGRTMRCAGRRLRARWRASSACSRLWARCWRLRCWGRSRQRGTWARSACW